MDPKPTPTASALAPLPEAPFSWTARVTSPEGFEELFTVRADTAGCFFPTLEVTREYLNEQGYRPISRGSGSSGSSTPQHRQQQQHGQQQQQQRRAPSSTPEWCSIHEVEMSRKNRGGDVWFSHKHESGWCRGEEG